MSTMWSGSDEPRGFLGMTARQMAILDDASAHCRAALSRALNSTGGLWTHAQTAVRLGVSEERLDLWRIEERLLALPVLPGVWEYPAGQFAPSLDGVAMTLCPLMPALMREVRDMISPDLLTPYLLESQLSLGGRTGMDCLFEGDVESVVELVRHTMCDDDLDE